MISFRSCRSACLAIGLGVSLATMASAQNATTAGKPTQLAVTSSVQLVDCAPVSLSPCLSARLTPTTSDSVPAPITLPPVGELAHAFTLTGPAGQVVPFYASAGTGPDAAQHVNVVLLLIDISGSMNDPMSGSTSRFAAAKSAIGQFLQGMQDGSDHIAIVPFESHNVVSTIRSAVFASHRSDALTQLNALPAPGPKNNTALYQAVFSGSQALQAEVSSLQHEGTTLDVQPHLIVMTDGKNEVFGGDDPLLLNGDLGLQQAAAQVQASHFDTIGIGFGDRAAIDTAALQRLSTRFFYAGDANQLLDALHVSRTAASHSVAVTWLLPEDSRAALIGRDPAWSANLRLPDGSTLGSTEMRLLTPATNSPVYQRKATPAELGALIATHPAPSAGWSIVLIHALLYLAAAALLLVLWFWLPRLIWGDRYSGLVPQKPQRWTNERTAVTSASGVQVRSANLPTGFKPETEAAGPLQRSAAQTTQIQPRGEFSKTRLTFD